MVLAWLKRFLGPGKERLGTAAAASLECRCPSPYGGKTYQHHVSLHCLLKLMTFGFLERRASSAIKDVDTSTDSQTLFLKLRNTCIIRPTLLSVNKQARRPEQLLSSFIARTCFNVGRPIRTTLSHQHNAMLI